MDVPVPTIVRTTYRPDIDGLRAIAVLSVLYFHYDAPLPAEWRLSGGFTGVDVFFVISGFLITSKLQDDIAAGTFSILGFYDRRIRRILPALIVMLITTLLAGKFLLMPGDYKSLSASTAAAAFGVSNFYFLANTGYFDQVADLLPLLHTWSLAVEEQFYVVWPILLLVIASGRARVAIAAVLGGIVIIGFAASLVWFDIDPKSAFFVAVPRAWELAIGALLVFLPPLPRVFGEIAAMLGLLLIGAGLVVVKAASFPGAAALYPCIGAALVIWPRVERTATASWLGILGPVGLISYSLYLWHWPVWVLFRIYINNGQPRIHEALALAIVSSALAVLSYFVVEKPFRKRRGQPAHSVQAGLFACILIFCCSMYVDSRRECRSEYRRMLTRCEAVMRCSSGHAQRYPFHRTLRNSAFSAHRGPGRLGRPSFGVTATPNTLRPCLRKARNPQASRSRYTAAARPSSTIYPAIRVS